jgi:hypothetical protein
MRSMGEIKEVIPMHVPGQNPQRPVGCIQPRRFNGRPAAEEIVNLSQYVLGVGQLSYQHPMPRAIERIPSQRIRTD